MATSRREFLKLAAAGALLAGAGSSCGRSPARPRNVLLLMADDLNLALSPWGHPAVHTPNIARLAARGVRFSRAFSPYPLCGPSRTALLTGRRPESFPMANNEVDWRSLDTGARTLPEIARSHGLHTRRCGKISHHGLPEGSAEREEILARGGLPHTHFDPPSWESEFGGFPSEYERSAEGLERVLAGNPHGGTSLHTMRVTTPDALPDHLSASRAVDFLRSDASREPFFLGVGFMKPHVPLFAPESCWARYDTVDVRALFSPSALVPPVGLPPGALLRQSFHRGLDEAAREHLFRGYLASVTWMDEQLGRVLDALDASHARDDTLIVFVSDHGYHLGEQGEWDKMMLFEPSLRVPLIVAGAAVPGRGAVCDALVESIDVFPTVCRIMNWDVPSSHGTDLSPWLADPQRPSTRAAFAWVQAGEREGWSVRTDTHRFSLMRRGSKGGPMLFDLTTDPAEIHNLAGTSACVDLERGLHAQLVAHFPDLQS